MKACLGCGTELSERNRKGYCSESCRYRHDSGFRLHRRKRNRINYKQRLMYVTTGGKPQRRCGVCGNVLRGNSGEYCSASKCQRAAVKIKVATDSEFRRRYFESRRRTDVKRWPKKYAANRARILRKRAEQPQPMPRDCQYCGKTLHNIHWGGKAKFCNSPACQREAAYTRLPIDKRPKRRIGKRGSCERCGTKTLLLFGREPLCGECRNPKPPPADPYSLGQTCLFCGVRIRNRCKRGVCHQSRCLCALEHKMRFDPATRELVLARDADRVRREGVRRLEMKRRNNRKREVAALMRSIGILEKESVSGS